MSLINSMLLKLEKKKKGNPSKRVLLPNNVSSIDPVSNYKSKGIQESIAIKEENILAYEFPLNKRDAFQASSSLEKSDLDTFIGKSTSANKSLLRVKTDNEFKIGVIIQVVKSYIKDLNKDNIEQYRINSNTFFKESILTKEAGKLIITPDQLEALKAAYKDAPSSILPGTPNYLKVTAILNVFDLASVKKISLANIPTLSKIAKELVGDKTESTLLKTGLDDFMQNHDHEYYLGDNRTQTGGDGHDHATVYKNGVLVGTGPASDDGHTHGAKE